MWVCTGGPAASGTPKPDDTCHQGSSITSHMSSILIQQLFMELLLWARLCPRGWGVAVTDDWGPW